MQTAPVATADPALHTVVPEKSPESKAPHPDWMRRLMSVAVNCFTTTLPF
jgi:hypothetical protein